MSEVILLDFWPSPFGMRLKIALALKGIKYENKQEDFSNKSPLLLQMNPVYKQIPVLIHNGKPISESLIALEYIDEVWNDESPLLSSDSYQRSQAKFWADYVDKEIYVVGRKIWRNKKGEQGNAKEELINALKLFEQEIGDKTYFGGENIGFLDVSLIPFYTWFKVYETFGNVNIEKECPKFIAWAKRCFEIKSVSKSLPDQDMVYDFIVEIRKKYGIIE